MNSYFTYFISVFTFCYLSTFSQTARIPHSDFSNNLEFKGQITFMNEANTATDLSNWYWCVSPIDDEQGKTHLFMSRWPNGNGMNGWMINCEFAHFVADKPEGPFTFVGKVLDNSTVPASWMKSPHNIRIKKVDDTFVIVFIVQDTRVGNVKGQKTCLMTSKSLNGPWTPVGVDGVVAQPSTNPSFWTYNSSIGCDNPDFDKINGKYYVYFKAGVAPDGRMHYGYAVADQLTGPYVVCDKPITDNISYLEDATTFNWDGERYLLTTDNNGGNTGIFGAGILWRSDVTGEFGPFHLSNAKIGFKILSDYTTIPTTSSYCYGTSVKFERPAVLMRGGRPAYFYAPNTCNFLGTGRPGTYIFKSNTEYESYVTLPNLANNATATASSQWDADYSATMAIDNNAGTRWSSASNDKNGAWLSIDFGTQITFNKVITKENAQYQRVSGYELQKWDGAAWADIITGTNMGVNKVDSFASVTTNKLRILITATSDCPTFDEILVYNSPNQRINFSLLPELVIGDSDYAPIATATSGLPVTFTSSDVTVAEIIDNKIHPIKAGNAYITANQVGNESFLPATPIKHYLTVSSKQISSVHSLNSLEKVSIYPNPAHDELTIKSETTVRSICIYDSYGNKVALSKPIKMNKINVSKFTNGVYFIYVETVNGISTMKFIKY